LFESELADARRLLDDTAKEKAREQIENRKNAALADEYKKKWVIDLNLFSRDYFS